MMNIIEIMPYCVVKSCNNSIGNNAQQTFHLFPDNVKWKQSWVEIIRQCRNEKDWTPSKLSLICSVHFEPTDLYTNQYGSIQLVNYAVPKRYLYSETFVRRNQGRHTVTSVADPLTVKRELDTIVNISDDDNKIISVDGPSIEVEQSTCIDVLNDDAEIISVDGPTIEVEQSTCIDVSNDDDEELRSESPINLVDLQEPLSPKTSRLKVKILKMQALKIKHKLKIKALQAQVRRLQKKNKTLQSDIQVLEKEREKYNKKGIVIIRNV